ncbi:MAG: aminotransferase class I/II-fold pyridoxal phosphate-dependent enzyme [Saprospirales bacterium]|nr:aminotransferase class I/II-fold pyridoxal phosphate-dependent enzyme [Saprospirales bacterium]
MHLSEILNHLGEERDNYFDAVAPPIIQTSNFAFRTLDEFRHAISDELESHIYSRGNNPTVEILRKKLAALEGAEDALVFSSGAGAISTAVIGNVKAGDHVVCVQNPYSWTKTLLMKLLPRFGVTHTFVDGTDTAAIEAAVQPNTTLLYLESPNSLTFELQDLEACVAIAKKHGLVSCIDNSYASPIYQQPIKLGVDIVLHSGTKYLNGHSDVVLGVLAGNKAMVKKLFNLEFMTLGGILGPHDAWLVLRGLRTLPLRVQRSHESALMIAQRLEAHPAVQQVNHPLLPSFPQYELAKKQMTGAGGLFSVYFNADKIEQMEAFFHSLQRFLLAVSWGGHESLVLPSAAFYKIPGLPDSPLPWNLVRFYIGLEEVEWLWEDLERGMGVFSF